MSNDIKKKEVVKVKITGIQKYGAFAVMEDNDYNGLIHISQISYGYVKNIRDFMNVGDSIYAEILTVDDENRWAVEQKQIKDSMDNYRGMPSERGGQILQL